MRCMEKKNVFSDASDRISILVYTQSFLYDNNVFQYFSDANLLKSIRIHYMPLLVKPEESLPVDTGIYRHTPRGDTISTIIEFSDCSSRVFISSNSQRRKTEDELKETAEKCILHNQLNRLFDYIVASDDWCKEHKEYDSIVSYSEAKEILRLFLIHKKEFEMVNSLYFDESLYYAYRHHALFPEYKIFWSSILKGKNDTDIDTANALGNRLLLFSMCIDNASIEAYKTQNSITAMHLKYHISYLLLLITGTFDSIAWIINNLYSLGFELKKRRQIDLINKDFRKAVEQKSSVLHNLLAETDFINRVEAIRELRDRIVHRNFIDTISNGNGEKRRDFLWIDQIASEKLLKAGFDEKWYLMKTDDLNAIDILNFLRYIQKVTVTIVNRFLKEISKEIFHSDTCYSINEMFQLPSESYVL